MCNNTKKFQFEFAIIVKSFSFVNKIESFTAAENSKSFKINLVGLCVKVERFKVYDFFSPLNF